MLYNSNVFSNETFIPLDEDEELYISTVENIEINNQTQLIYPESMYYYSKKNNKILINAIEFFAFNRATRKKRLLYKTDRVPITDIQFSDKFKRAAFTQSLPLDDNKLTRVLYFIDGERGLISKISEERDRAWPWRLSKDGKHILFGLETYDPRIMNNKFKLINLLTMNTKMILVDLSPYDTYASFLINRGENGFNIYAITEDSEITIIKLFISIKEEKIITKKLYYEDIVDRVYNEDVWGNNDSRILTNTLRVLPPPNNP